MLVQAESAMENVNIVAESLNAIVKVKTGSSSWKAIADVASVSATGAGFYVENECQVGRLVSLVMPLDPSLRIYDHDRDLYTVWGLVQHCHKLPVEEKAYHVGVAFIGKHAPESYREDPSRSYKICGMDENGLWKIRETDNDFKTRKDTRYFKSIDLYLALTDAKKSSLGGEKTTTENISRSGAAVLSELSVDVGDRVKFISERYNFSGIAVVCNRKVGDDGRARLHLHFVENMFPVESLSLTPSEESAEHASD